MSSLNTSHNNNTPVGNSVANGNSGSAGGRPSAVNQTAEEGYMPNILEHLRTGKGPLPEVKCPMCEGKVLIPGLPGHSQEDSDSDEEYEDACTLPCGHIFGKDCFNQWARRILQNLVAGPGPKCPVCRKAIFSEYMTQEDIVLQLEDEYDAEEGESDAENSEGGQEESGDGDDEEERVRRATLWPALSLGSILASAPLPRVSMSDDEE